MRDNTSLRKKRRARLWVVPLLVPLLSASCDKTPPPPSLPVDAGAPSSPVVPGGRLSKLPLPTAVLACAVVARQGDSWLLPRGRHTHRPGSGMLVSALQQRFGLKGDAFMAPAGRAHVVVVQTAGGTSVAVSTAVISKDEALASMPTERRTQVGGNAYAYAAADGEVYANFIDHHLVLTRAEAVFPTHQVFFRQLLGVRVKEGIEVTVAVGRAAQRYRPQLAKFVAEFGADQQPFSLAEQARGWLALARDTQRLNVQIERHAGVVTLTARVKPKPDGALHATLAAVTPTPLALLPIAPADAAAVVAVSIDRKGPKRWHAAMSEWMTQAALAADRSGPAYRQARAALQQQATGDMLLVLHSVEQRAAVSALFGVRDSDATRRALAKLHAAHSDAGVKKLYAALGVEPRAQRAAYRIGEVAVDVVNTTPLKPNPRQPSVPIVMASGALLQLLTAHTTVVDERLLRTFGSASKVAMTAWVEGEVTPAGDRHTRRHSAPGAFLLAYADVQASRALLRQLSAAPALDA
ncbi:MAG TPA: hypothetical protein ENK23_07790, partial [Sorangium sp.]|nr:hypothetical protein [Sorangium sp.]